MTNKIRRALINGFRDDESTKYAEDLNVLVVPGDGPNLKTCLRALVEAVIDTNLETKMFKWQEEKINIEVSKMQLAASLPK